MTVRAPVRLLAVTIDTEEEGRWGGGYPREGHTCANIRWLEKLEPLRREHGLRATYLVTDPVVRDAEARDRLAAFVAEERSEIGAHLHPWCTPPYDEIDRTVTYAGNLPGPLLRAKLGGLTETIERAFGVRPVSYRAGGGSRGRRSRLSRSWAIRSTAPSCRSIGSMGTAARHRFRPLRFRTGPEWPTR